METQPLTKEMKDRLALKSYVKKSKVLRFRDRMHNVRVWKRNCYKFQEKHPEKVDNPPVDDIHNYVSPELLQELH